MTFGWGVWEGRRNPIKKKDIKRGRREGGEERRGEERRRDTLSIKIDLKNSFLYITNQKERRARQDRT